MTIQAIDISKVTNQNYYTNKYRLTSDEIKCNPNYVEIRRISGKLYDNLILSLKDNGISFSLNSEKNNFIDLLISCDLKYLNKILGCVFKYEKENYGMITNVIDNYLYYNSKKLKIKQRTFNFNKTGIMGIVNVTPDSFSDGGKYFSHEKAISRALKMLDSGVDIIDIGGESTRPGSNSISAEVEIERIIPVISEISSRRPEAIISVDTSKAIVAERAIASGASMINDISAFTFDKEIVDVAKDSCVPYCLMHILGEPKNMQNNPKYDDPVAEIYDFLADKIEYLYEVGVENIVIDPGIGFGKRIADNMEIIRRLSEFHGLGFPILVGASRKSFLGNILNLEVNERDTATIIAETFAVQQGATFIRTHNTENALQLKKLNNFDLTVYN